MLRKAAIHLFILSIIGIFATGCEDNPVDNDENNDHAEAAAMLVMLGSDTLLYQDETEGVLAESGIQISVGETANTIEVMFLAHDGDQFQPEEDHFSLSAEIGNTDIAEVLAGESRWEFTVKGNIVGETHLTVKLMHGDHPDFTGEQINVHVE